MACRSAGLFDNFEKARAFTDDYLGTEGCVSLKKSDLLEILPILTAETSIQISRANLLEQNPKINQQIQLHL